MRRPRRNLVVTTFPFLAVLLCTMGSLILLLLVLDRRAKIVALSKANNDYAAFHAEQELALQQNLRQQSEIERLTMERQQERNRLQSELHDRLVLQEQDLLGQIDQTRKQLNQAENQMQAARLQADQQQSNLRGAQEHLLTTQQSVKAQESARLASEHQSEAAKRELDRQAAELRRLEKMLADLKAFRDQQKNTYSLVPYLGRRGDNRKPIYVECAGSGVTFHTALKSTPPKLDAKVSGSKPPMPLIEHGANKAEPATVTFAGLKLTPELLRAEVEMRIALGRDQASQPPGGESLRPYLLMLVRPDGINNYYKTQEALAGLKLDFGYEFIEQDWNLDFSAPAQGAISQPLLASNNAPPLAPAPPPGFGVGGHAPGQPGSKMPGTSNPGKPDPKATAGVTGSGQPLLGLPKPNPGFPAQSGLVPGSSNPGSLLTLSPPVGGNNGPQGMPNGLPGLPQTNPPKDKGSPGGTKSDPQLAVGKSPEAVRGKETPGDPSQAAGAVANGQQPAVGIGKLSAPASTPPPLGRILGNRDWLIYVECSAQGVVLKHGNQKFSLESLAVPTKGEHTLVQTVREIIARRQATVGPGEPPYRPMLRFLVNPDGLRAYYLAYPLLDVLRLPMQRENVEEDY